MQWPGAIGNYGKKAAENAVSGPREFQGVDGEILSHDGIPTEQKGQLNEAPEGLARGGLNERGVGLLSEGFAY
jgi:hypothetical protein